MHAAGDGHHDIETGNHEPDEIAFGATMKVGAALTVVTLVSYLIVLGVYKGFDSMAVANEPAPLYPLAVGLGDRLPPEPRLQVTPKQDMQHLRDADTDLLEHYQWVDKNAGVVRIPIEEAMKLTVERGLPSRPAAPATAQEAAR